MWCFLKRRGVEHVNIGDEGIDTANLIPAKYVEIDQVFIKNPVTVFAGVVQVQRHGFKTIDDVLNLDLRSAAAQSLSPFHDGLHAVRFVRHQTLSRQTPYAA